MSITLTGHKGLVGSAISKEILTVNFEKRITDLNEYKEFLEKNSIKSVIHTAARVGGVLDNWNNKIDFYLQNSKLNNIVFEAAYTSGVETFVNFSSTCVFPDKCDYPLKESDVFMGPPHYTNDSYAYAKRMNQHLCNEARKLGKNYFTIIPTNVFGPNDNYNLNSSHVLPALIHKCYLSKCYRTDFIVWGDGTPLREFIYSKDLAKITCELMNTNKEHESVIVSNSEEVSIQECVEIIAKILKFNGNIIFDTSKPNGQFRKPTDTTTFKSLMPDFKFTPFNEALGESINWFEKNYHSLRK